MNTNRQEKAIKELFLGECWMYLRSNFSKFSEANKIKIALTLAQKDFPQEITGLEMKQIVVMNEIKRSNQPLRFNIGSPDASGDTEHPLEVTADNNQVQ